jgi:hypothetical protein
LYCAAAEQAGDWMSSTVQCVLRQRKLRIAAMAAETKV